MYFCTSSSRSLFCSHISPSSRYYGPFLMCALQYHIYIVVTRRAILAKVGGLRNICWIVRKFSKKHNGDTKETACYIIVFVGCGLKWSKYYTLFQKYMSFSTLKDLSGNASLSRVCSFTFSIKHTHGECSLFTCKSPKFIERSNRQTISVLKVHSIVIRKRYISLSEYFCTLLCFLRCSYLQQSIDYASLFANLYQSESTYSLCVTSLCL